MIDATTEEKLIGRREGQVGHLIFNNPAKLNAVSLDMWDKAFTVLDGFARDPEIRVVVVSGAGGKAFVSGADISKFESERASEEAAAKYNATSLNLIAGGRGARAVPIRVRAGNPAAAGSRPPRARAAPSGQRRAGCGSRASPAASG